MPELPGHLAGWGILPVLGHLGPVPIYSYETLVLLALLAAAALLWWDTRAQAQSRRGELLVLAVAALVGGAAGAKLLEWALHPSLFAAAGWGALVSGRTVLGGLLGGWLAVAIAKRRMGISGRRGNLLAAPIALGLLVGRIGCFLNGCCHGTATGLPWGVDFGDGIRRHPTQLYEAAFALAALVVLRLPWRRRARPGRLFGLLMVAYLAFRFAEEFVRAGEHPLLGFSPYQVLALAGLIWFLARELRPAPVPDRDGGLVPP
ncbi:MAG TPA: prolipoprotein diacylglyceryl transferase family protein [Longimicrobiales bacterium]